ncbi:MAG: carboxypeptidase regulatory-like domain-containing protein [Chitinophagaceae bacterium]
MRRNTNLLRIFSLLALAAVTFNCSKQDRPAPEHKPRPGVVQGKISNEFNQPLTDVLLTIQGNGANTSIKTIGGNYIFDSLSAGSYNLAVRKDGYIEASAAISIAPGDTISKDFVLKTGAAYFNLLSDTVIIARPYAGTFIIKIASNTSWVVNSANNWITPEKLSSNGDDSIVVRVAASTADTIRQ